MPKNLMTSATIRFPHERDCYVFGNSTFRKHDESFPKQKKAVKLLRMVSDMNVPQVMQLVEQMRTNTNYWFNVFTNDDSVLKLEKLGFIVTVE